MKVKRFNLSGHTDRRYFDNFKSIKIKLICTLLCKQLGVSDGINIKVKRNHFYRIHENTLGQLELYHVTCKVDLYLTAAICYIVSIYNKFYERKVMI
jgi:hypothetical protein